MKVAVKFALLVLSGLFFSCQMIVGPEEYLAVQGDPGGDGPRVLAVTAVGYGEPLDSETNLTPGDYTPGWKVIVGQGSAVNNVNGLEGEITLQIAQDSLFKGGYLKTTKIPDANGYDTDDAYSGIWIKPVFEFPADTRIILPNGGSDLDPKLFHVKQPPEKALTSRHGPLCFT